MIDINAAKLGQRQKGTCFAVLLIILYKQRPQIKLPFQSTNELLITVETI